MKFQPAMLVPCRVIGPGTLFAPDKSPPVTDLEATGQEDLAAQWLVSNVPVTEKLTQNVFIKVAASGKFSARVGGKGLRGGSLNGVFGKQ